MARKKFLTNANAIHDCNLRGDRFDRLSRDRDACDIALINPSAVWLASRRQRGFTKRRVKSVKRAALPGELIKFIGPGIIATGLPLRG